MTTRELLNTFSREEGIALFNAKKTDKEVYDILVSKGLTDSFDTFTAEAQKVFAEKVSQMSKEEILSQIEGAELTDEQLKMIAGGGKSYKEEATNVGMYSGIGAGALCTIGAGLTIAAVTGSSAAFAI